MKKECKCFVLLIREEQKKTLSSHKKPNYSTFQILRCNALPLSYRELCGELHHHQVHT